MEGQGHYVGTDFGPNTLTNSGYARIVKEWKRGTKLSEAITVYEAQQTDIGAGAARSWDHGATYDFVSRVISFFANEQFIRGADGKLTKIEIPNDAGAGVWNKQILITLRSDWTVEGKTWPRGALLGMPLADFLAGKRTFTMLFEPSPTKSLAGSAEFKSALVINELEDIKNHLYVWTVGKNNKWSKKPFGVKEDLGSTLVWPVDAAGVSDDYWIAKSDFLVPDTIALGKLGGTPQVLKTQPAFYDAKGLHVEQHFAKSKDGTRVPYSRSRARTWSSTARTRRSSTAMVASKSR